MPKKKLSSKNSRQPKKTRSSQISSQDDTVGEKVIIEKFESVSLEEEVKLSYIDYAMSVIIARALPDVRDGLKPVHRRILYTMNEMGLRHNVKFRKSATVVGSVLGRYHPHGDQSVYDSLVRMAQDFSLRYPLVDGQGNFGSIDGDSAAAYRYTESRLTSIAEEMLFDIDLETVNFVPNYDGTLKEPQVLPAKLPNLLLNGSMGIAVGMATNIPPHNLSEVCDALIYLIEHPKAGIDELFNFIKGPDFPTGGIIFNIDQIKQVYAIGKGPITIRAKTEIIEKVSGQFQIIVHELPYVVNKASLLTKIAELVKSKRLEGVKDIRDESDRQGLRVVFDLKRAAFPQKILNRLFKLTDLQVVFHVNIVALLDGIQPKIFGLKELLTEYISHRQSVVYRRTDHNLIKTKERIHILNGLVIAIDHIDAIIKLIKASKDREIAKTNLMKKYRLSEIQAQAILETRLHQLANLERKKIKDELKEKIKIAKELSEILAKPKMILKIIKDEIKELKEKYGDERRTKVVSHEIEEFKQEDLIPNEPAVIILTQDGYIKRVSPESFKSQARGGKGVSGMGIKEEDRVQHLIITTTHANMLFFTTKGRVFQLKAYEVPQSQRTARGQSLVNFLEIASDEKVSVILSTAEVKSRGYLMMVTRNGIIKKVPISAFENVRRSGLIAIKLKKDDTLEWVKTTLDNDEIILVSNQGKSIRFKEKDLRPLSRVAAGVRGMKLKPGDQIVGMDILRGSHQSIDQYKLLVITENGFGKMTELKNYRFQKRGGLGIKTAKVNEKTGRIVGGIVIIKVIDDLLVISRLGQIIRLPLESVPTMNRSTQGVRLMRFKKEKDRVSSFNLI
ncbi:DNA gyrase subunit A [Patescibacteria group bacterium]|nr:DNA gyrase subunit A [Patescibacteria group bacterium]